MICIGNRPCKVAPCLGIPGKSERDITYKKIKGRYGNRYFEVLFAEELQCAEASALTVCLSQQLQVALCALIAAARQTSMNALNLKRGLHV